MKFLRKLFFYIWLIAVVPGMLPSFLCVRAFHANELLKEDNVDSGNKAGSVFLGYATSFALLIYFAATYLILS